MQTLIVAAALLFASAGTAFAECRHVTTWQCFGPICSWQTVWQCEPVCRDHCVWERDFLGNEVRICRRVCR